MSLYSWRVKIFSVRTHWGSVSTASTRTCAFTSTCSSSRRSSDRQLKKLRRSPVRHAPSETQEIQVVLSTRTQTRRDKCRFQWSNHHQEWMIGFWNDTFSGLVLCLGEVWVRGRGRGGVGGGCSRICPRNHSRIIFLQIFLFLAVKSYFIVSHLTWFKLISSSSSSLTGPTSILHPLLPFLCDVIIVYLWHHPIRSWSSAYLSNGCGSQSLKEEEPRQELESAWMEHQVSQKVLLQ